MDTLTTRIWDLLYRLGHAESIETLAEQLGETPEAIEQARAIFTQASRDPQANGERGS